MASSTQVTLSCALILCIVVIASAPYGEAITCGQVASSVSQCITYLKSKGGNPPPACCSGIRSLNALASTTPAKKTACGCLKSTAASIRGINYGLASGLPGKCGVSISYTISPSTDCNKIQ